MIDEIDPLELILPLIVMDVGCKVAQDEDSQLFVRDVHAWEAVHGMILRDCLVAVMSNWCKRWPNDSEVQDRDERGIAHWRGLDLEAVQHRAETACDGHRA